MHKKLYHIPCASRESYSHRPLATCTNVTVQIVDSI